MTSFSPLLWFEKLFGFKDTPDNVNKNMECEETDEGSILILKNQNKKRINAGKFSLCSISTFEGLIPRNNGHLHIIHGHGMSSQKLYMVDVMEAQCHPDFDGATFQAASNFNCLEFIGSKETAAKGVNVYIKDHTQGPFCAVAAGPALTYRNYFVLHDDGTTGQLKKEVELLSRTPLKIEHGYVKINQNECERLQGLNFDWSDMDKYQVGLHRNCKITVKRSERGLSLVTLTDQITHQVYCAAFSFPRSVIVNDFTKGIAKNLLRAEYRTTILAAWDNSLKFPERKGAKKCFLTLLGGGVFHNPFEIICGAIADCRDVVVQSGLDVYVVCFNDNDFSKAHPLLKKVVDETGGSVIDA